MVGEVLPRPVFVRYNGGMEDTIRILLAEDHHVVRTAVASLLARRPDMEVVGEVGEGGEPLLEAVARLEPDLLLLDAHMPGHDAVKSVRRMAEAYPDVRILVLSAYERQEYVVGLLEAGASGYVLKDDSSQMLLRAIRIVAEGGDWVSPKATKVLVNSMRNRVEAPGDSLTGREMDVLKALAQGNTNSKIAETLNIGEQTVKNHMSQIFKKLGVETRVEAVLYAIRHGLASPEE